MASLIWHYIIIVKHYLKHIIEHPSFCKSASLLLLIANVYLFDVLSLVHFLAILFTNCCFFVFPDAGCDRALIIARVLVSKIDQGCKDKIVPSKEFDTLIGNKGKVFVKFYDHEMLPIFVAFFRDSTFARGNPSTFNLAKHENLQPISGLENKSHHNGPNSTPVRNKNPKKKPFNSQSNEFHSGQHQVKPRPSLRNTGRNVNYPITNQPYVPSQSINNRSSYPANQRPQSIQSQIDRIEIHTHHSNQNRTLVQHRLSVDDKCNKNQHKSADKSSKSCCFISCCKSITEFIFCCWCQS